MRRFAGWMVGIVFVGALACAEDITGPCERGGLGCDPVRIDGAALFAQVCGGCHSIERPIAAPIGWREDAWALVRKMKKNGLVLTEQEASAIVDYLCAYKQCVVQK